ncbi:NnrS family protein [Brucella sp. 09RB8910]|nr:NnrS family protein [Brucella sp. 09RB8910]
MTTQQGLQASPATMSAERKGGIPRGLKMTGPVILSYGFRPFFLGGAIWAVMAMLLWILSLTIGLPLGAPMEPSTGMHMKWCSAFRPPFWRGSC